MLEPEDFLIIAPISSRHLELQYTPSDPVTGSIEDQHWGFFFSLVCADEDSYGRMPGLATNHPVWLTTSNHLHAEHRYRVLVGRPLAVSAVAVIVTASAQQADTTSRPDQIGIIRVPRYLFPDRWEGVQGPAPIMEEGDVSRADKWIAYYPRRDANIRITFPPLHPYPTSRLINLMDPLEDPNYRYQSLMPTSSATPTLSHATISKIGDQEKENDAGEEEYWSSESDEEFE